MSREYYKSLGASDDVADALVLSDKALDRQLRSTFKRYSEYAIAEIDAMFMGALAQDTTGEADGTD